MGDSDILIRIPPIRMLCFEIRCNVVYRVYVPIRTHFQSLPSHPLLSSPIIFGVGLMIRKCYKFMVGKFLSQA